MAGSDKMLMNYNFVAYVMGAEFRASKISNIECSLDTEVIQEGGLNSYTHVLVKPKQEMQKLVFERGYCSSIDALILDKLIGVYHYDPITIFIYDKKFINIVHTYSVTGWTIIKWQISDLDAQSGAVLLETVDIAYETLLAL